MTMPFGDEVMTIIMGIDPSDPGMHGPMKEPCPGKDAVDLVCKIRDMCDEWLQTAGKCEDKEKPESTASQKSEDEEEVE